MNIFETFMEGATVYDVSPDYLRKFERYKLSKGNSPATIASNITDLKRILNYYTKVKKVIPRDYEYPFSEAGYRINNFIPTKFVMENEEIKSVVDMKGILILQNKSMLVISGFCYTDVMVATLWICCEWGGVYESEGIRFYRKKTETTRKKNIKQITVPRTLGVNNLLEKIGNKDSLFVLGLLQEGYSEETIDNNQTRWEWN